MPLNGAQTLTEKVAICFVAHKGFLEIQAILLTLSLRFYNQSKYDLFVAVPTFLGGVLNGLTSQTRLILSDLGVNFIEIENKFEHDYLIGNKFGCLNRIHGHKLRLFLDTDIICTGKLILPKLNDGEIAIKPADRKTFTWTDSDWKRAYEEFTGSSAPADKVQSSCFKETMFPYYNAGVININSEVEFGSLWQGLSLELDSNNSYNNKRPWLDQLSLPLTVRKHNLDVVAMTEQHNFPANIKHDIGSDVQLVHYHKAKNIARNQRLLSEISRLITYYPDLEQVLSSSSEWSIVTDVINTYNRFNHSFKHKLKDTLITGIPRSGTSLMSFLLAQNKNIVVINEPQGFPKPLKRRSLPWGVRGLFLDLRRDINAQKPVLNKQKDGVLTDDTINDNNRREQVFTGLTPDFDLIIKNTLAGLIGLDRIIKTFSDLKLLICFRDPFDTLASWKNSFQHLNEALPSNIGVVSAQLKWMNSEERKNLLQIEEESCSFIRRALLWRFLGNKVIQFSKLEQAMVVNYKDLTGQVASEINRLSKHLNVPNMKSDFDLQNRSSRHLLTEEEEKVINEICSPVYQQLCNLKTKL